MTEISSYRGRGLTDFLGARARGWAVHRRPLLLPGRHLPTLDAVRGIAVLMIMAFHFTIMFGESTPLSRAITHVAILGRCGVDLFFVLSGFLITGILYDAKESQGYFKTFYARRILRITPLYYASLVLLLFIVPLVLGRVPASYHDILSYQGWLWFHTVNIGLIRTGPYHLGPLGHLWSLAIEEHFYLIWPLVVFCFNRQTLMKLCVAVAVASLMLRVALMSQGDNSQICYLLTPCRFDQLLIGAFVALAARGPLGLTPLVRPARWIAPVSFLALLAIFVMRDRLHDAERHDVLMPTIGYTVVAIGFAAVIILAIVVQQETRMGRLMHGQLLRTFGKYSYALYIFHPFVIERILALYPQRGMSWLSTSSIFVTLCAVCFAASLAVAWISWNGWEKHFLKLKRFFVYRAPSPTVEPSLAAAI
jgi:peptidoglycan/LPS O-acetylase OafA/YrhL